jgi:hypothetical protein
LHRARIVTKEISECQFDEVSIAHTYPTRRDDCVTFVDSAFEGLVDSRSRVSNNPQINRGEIRLAQRGEQGRSVGVADRARRKWASGVAEFVARREHPYSRTRMHGH